MEPDPEFASVVRQLFSEFPTASYRLLPSSARTIQPLTLVVARQLCTNSWSEETGQVNPELPS